MKIKVILIFLAIIFIIGCKNKYIIPYYLTRSGYEIKNKGVNVRIINEGETYYTKIELDIDDKIFEFCGLKPGQTTGYQNLPYIFDNQIINIWRFTKRSKLSGKIYTFSDQDTLKIKPGGFVTIVVKPILSVESNGNKKVKIWKYRTAIAIDSIPDKRSLKITKQK